jgi:mono/diheme cytochrome c family protein
VQQGFDVPGLFDDWKHKIKPRDLTKGLYRGGRRPVDLYRRISAGIKGTPMPAFGTVLKDEEIWDLVNYIMHVPHVGRMMSEPTESTKELAAGGH